MNRRLRKKLHMGEFAESGFELKVSLNPNIVNKELDSFWDNFIDEVERLGLQIAGGGLYELEVFVTVYKGSPNEAQKNNLTDWLSKCQYVTKFEVGKMVDAWRCNL